MKRLIAIMLLASNLAYAEFPCDIRLGESIGLRVVEFTTGHVIHSKMSLKESSGPALREEIINLQDEGICTEQIPLKKCVLKYEKVASRKDITLYRGSDKWQSWNLSAKKDAQEFVISLRRAGFCS